ncbi:hypothetical protein CHS0354_043024 [Potamilus streckersoni]|uniref:Uncharacterized protein n=1 Tax=Potamilus streckersoni TaxID=2493646 RepID=A0AAE0SCV1_9BIVA|nr:hypothetical protein CHS0354_043024 [Potamilus streckersoni]
MFITSGGKNLMQQILDHILCRQFNSFLWNIIISKSKKTVNQWTDLHHLQQFTSNIYPNIPSMWRSFNSFIWNISFKKSDKMSTDELIYINVMYKLVHHLGCNYIL